MHPGVVILKEAMAQRGRSLKPAWSASLTLRSSTATRGSCASVAHILRFHLYEEVGPGQDRLPKVGLRFRCACQMPEAVDDERVSVGEQ